MNWKAIVSYISSGIAAVCGGCLINVNEILSTILTVVGILGAACTLFLNCWTIVDKIIAYKKNDGKIDDKEKEEIKKDIKDAVDEFKEDIK